MQHRPGLTRENRITTDCISVLGIGNLALEYPPAGFRQFTRQAKLPERIGIRMMLVARYQDEPDLAEWLWHWISRDVKPSVGIIRDSQLSFHIGLEPVSRRDKLT